MYYSKYARRVIDEYPSGMRVYRRVVESKVRHMACANVLHLGCGRDLGGMLELFPSSVRVVGIDPDPHAISKYPGEGHVGDGGSTPFPDAEFDLVFSEMVLEHLEDPETVFKEVARILKPGGSFVSVTPNFYSYKSIAAALTPHWFHKAAVRILRRDSIRDDDDVYPTVYKANTRSALESLARASGLRLSKLQFVDNGPTWFQRIPGVFELGRLYHCMLKAPDLSWLRCNIVCVFEK